MIKDIKDKAIEDLKCDLCFSASRNLSSFRRLLILTQDEELKEKAHKLHKELDEIEHILYERRRANRN